MTQPAPTRLRQHIYPDGFYGETPHLALPGVPPEAATNLARLIVKLGVDGRGPRIGHASSSELSAAIPRLQAMNQAARAAGFMVDVRLNGTHRPNTVRAQYRYRPGEVGLLVADRPAGKPPRLFDLQWILQGDGVYAPAVAVAEDAEAVAGPEDYAAQYETIWRRVMDADSAAPLGLVYARINQYHPLPSPPAEAIGAAVPAA